MSQTQRREELATSHETKINELWARAGKRVEQLRDLGVDPERYAWAKATEAQRYVVHRRANNAVVQLAIELEPYYRSGDIREEAWTDPITTVQIGDDRIREAVRSDTFNITLQSLDGWGMSYADVDVDSEQRRVQLLLPPQAIQSVYSTENAILHDLGFATAAEEERGEGMY